MLVLLLAFVVNAIDCYLEHNLCNLMLGMLLLRCVVVHADVHVVAAGSWDEYCC